MKRKFDEYVFQCRFPSNGTLGLAILLMLFFFVIILLIFSTNEISITEKLILIGMIALAICVLAFESLRDGKKVLTITQDEIVLTKFGREVTSFRRDEVVMAGSFVYGAQGIVLIYISAEPLALRPDDKMPNKARFKRILKTANKKGSKIVGVQQTTSRLEAIKKLLPEFSESNKIKLP